MLSPQLLELLRDWWWAARPQGWLFPGQNPVSFAAPCTPRRRRQGIAKRVSPHTLRQ